MEETSTLNTVTKNTWCPFQLRSKIFQQILESVWSQTNVSSRVSNMIPTPYSIFTSQRIICQFTETEFLTQIMPLYKEVLGQMKSFPHSLGFDARLDGFWHKSCHYITSYWGQKKSLPHSLGFDARQDVFFFRCSWDETEFCRVLVLMMI
jgi:hypothetical protein